MTQQLHFYDAANSHNVPSGVHAAVYVNGFAWAESEVKRMARIFRVSVRSDARWARLARCIDIEAGAARPADAVSFIRHRRAIGFPDSTCYVNRSNWQEVYERVRHANLPEPLWWVATLDGTRQVALSIAGRTVAHAWAVQFETVNGFDLSVLHGNDNFVRP